MIKAKEEMLALRLQSGGHKTVKAFIIGEYAYHELLKSDGYSITHIPSLSRIHDMPSQKGARQLAYKFSTLKTTWDGSNPVADNKEVIEFKRAIIQAFMEFEES